MVETSSREALRGGEVAIFDLLARTMTTEQWATWLKTPLELAAAQGDASLSRKLMGAGAEVGHALHGAIQGRHEEIVTNLLDYNAEAALAARDEDNQTLLHLAVSRTSAPDAERCDEAENTWWESIVQRLLRKGADPNAMGQWGTPMHDACSDGSLGATRALLEAGGDCNLPAAEGDARSALDLAAGTSTADMMRLLIGHGGDFTAAGPHGNTPLHYAGYSHFAEVADVLAEAGASIEVRNRDNESPLHFAAGRVNPTMVHAFLKLGLDANDRCQFAQTPLHKAAVTAVSEPARRWQAARVVDLLLRSGADETLVDADGLTAQDLLNMDLEESMEDEDVVKRARELLANAPADKAWRRRGYWALCRAHPDRLQEDLLRPDNSRPRRGKRRSTRSRLHRSSMAAEADLRSNGSSWAGAAGWMFGLGEEAIFRTIVGYL